MVLRTAAVAAFTLVAVAAPVMPAYAASQYSGGCGIVAVHAFTYAASSESVVPFYAGAFVVDIMVTSGGAPASADVHCSLLVNNVELTSADTHVDGATVGAFPASFAASDTAHLAICTTVDFADSTPDAGHCKQVDRIAFPPDEVWDATAFAREPAVIEVCNLLRALYPGVGPVRIGSDGDVSIGLDALVYWDCPPYTTPDNRPSGVIVAFASPR
jgi:hypothetical protein